MSTFESWTGACPSLCHFVIISQSFIVSISKNWKQAYILFGSPVRINTLTPSTAGASTSEYVHSLETRVALILATGTKPTGFFIPTMEKTPQKSRSA